MIPGMLEVILRDPSYVEKVLLKKDWAKEVKDLRIVIEHGSIEISWCDPSKDDGYYASYQCLTLLLVAGNPKLVAFLNAVEDEFTNNGFARAHA